MAELISRPLVEIAQELRERRFTSLEVVEAAIARHERFGERLHAYCLWTPEKARETAKAADAAFASGATVGPLQGLPISIKDLYAAEGLPCFAGSSRRLPADPWEKDGPGPHPPAPKLEAPRCTARTTRPRWARSVASGLVEVDGRPQFSHFPPLRW
jgi:hypothetical protein